MKYIFYLMFLLLPSSAYSQAVWEFLGFTKVQVIASVDDDYRLFENINKETGQLMLTKMSSDGVLMTLYTFTDNMASGVVLKDDLKLMREISGLTGKPDVEGLYDMFHKSIIENHGFRYVENVVLNNLNFRKYKRGRKLVLMHQDNDQMWLIAKYD